MLVYWDGRMYYSSTTVWCTSALLTALLPAGVWLLRAEQCVLEEKWLAALDWVLAAFMVNGLLTPMLQWNLTPSGRADLYVLRSVSAVLSSAALIALTVHTLTRTQLALSTALYVGISCNLASWSSAFWLHMQATGLGGLLPVGVRHTLRTKPLLQWLRDDYLTTCFQQLRRIAPLVLLPAEHLEAALAVMPPELRDRLQQPLVAELPAPVRELVQPWQDGPGHLRVRSFCLPKLSLRETNNHHDHRDEPPADAAALPRPAAPVGRINDCAPEWVYVYVLRRHLRTRFRALWTADTRRAALLALLAAAATSRLSARRGAASARLALATGLAVFAAQTCRVRHAPVTHKHAPTFPSIAASTEPRVPSCGLRSHSFHCATPTLASIVRSRPMLRSHRSPRPMRPAPQQRRSLPRIRCAAAASQRSWCLPSSRRVSRGGAPCRRLRWRSPRASHFSPPRLPISGVKSARRLHD